MGSGFSVPAGFSCINAQRTCLSHASLSKVKYPLENGKENTGADTNLSCNADDASCSSCKRASNILGSPILSFLLSSPDKQAKLGTECWPKWHNSRNDLNSSMFRDCFKSQTVSVICSVSSNLPGCKTCPR